jgi:hypothetical protein
MLGEVETHVVDCFYKGGGVPYNAFSRFYDVMRRIAAKILSPLSPIIFFYSFLV